MVIDKTVANSTDRSVTIQIIDATDRTPETGVLFDTAGLSLWYRREGGAVVTVTTAQLATPAANDPHLDGGFIHLADGNYRFDLPDAAFAGGARHVDVGGTVTGMIVIGGRVEIDHGDYVEGGGVWCDPGNGFSGQTIGLNGTLRYPANTFQQAYDIAEILGTGFVKLVPRSYGGINPADVHPFNPGTNPAILDINGRYTRFSSGPSVFDSGNANLYSSIPGALFVSPTLSIGSYWSDARISGNFTVEGGVFISYCDIDEGVLQITFQSLGDLDMYGCRFLRNDSGGAVPMTEIVYDPAGTSRNLRLIDCYGNVKISGLDSAIDRVLYLGWGKLVIANDCTAGSVQHVSHVEVLGEDGNPYSGPVSVELVSQSSFAQPIPEAYRSTGVAGTPAQLLYEILGHLGEFGISGTTKTVRQLDGTTPAKTYTLDDDTNPTSITEAT